MNKRMKALYAQIEFLGDWTKNDIQAKYSENPEKEEFYSALLTEIGLKMLSLADEIDKERIAYRNQPLWKQLFTK
jgi:hypothetical protein